jgi:putative transcriptional regulator
MKKYAPSRLAEAILEMSEDLHRHGIMPDAEYNEIVLRHGNKLPAAPLTGKEIREVRKQAHLSQAGFARYLNVTAGYVSQLERGIKHASGPILVLLNVIRNKGIEVVLR